MRVLPGSDNPSAGFSRASAGTRERASFEVSSVCGFSADEWTIIVSKDGKVQRAADYKQENDAARIAAKPETIPVTIETFTIELGDVKGASATVNFLWDKTRVPVKLTTGDVEQVSKQLDAVVSAKTPLDPRTAYQAAAFYYDNNKDMKQAATVDRPGAGEERRHLLHALHEGADSGQTWR